MILNLLDEHGCVEVLLCNFYLSFDKIEKITTKIQIDCIFVRDVVFR